MELQWGWINQLEKREREDSQERTWAKASSLFYSNRNLNFKRVKLFFGKDENLKTIHKFSANVLGSLFSSCKT